MPVKNVKGFRYVSSEEICGIVYKIWIVDPEVSDLIEGLEGLTDFVNGDIFINKTLSPSRRREVYVHELLCHGLMDASGAGYILREKLGLSKNRWNEFEEHWARVYSPALTAFMIRKNLITFPKGLES